MDNKYLTARHILAPVEANPWLVVDIRAEFEMVHLPYSRIYRASSRSWRTSTPNGVRLLTFFLKLAQQLM